MAKSYPERLGEWVKQRTSTRRDKNLVAFLSVRDDVKAAVEAGYAVKTVWANMAESGRIGFGYDTFLNYVNRMVRRTPASHAAGVPPAPQARRTPIGSSRTTTGTAATAAKSMKLGPPAGFTFNPEPNKEELL